MTDEKSGEHQEATVTDTPAADSNTAPPPSQPSPTATDKTAIADGHGPKTETGTVTYVHTYRL